MENLPITTAVILGLIQGLTEFFPVSSSGHLLITEAIFRVRPPGLTFEVMLHLGSLLAVCVYLARPLRHLVAGVLGFGRDGPAARRVLMALVLGSLPAGAAGLLASDFISRHLLGLPNVAAALVATTAMLLVSGRLAERGLPQALTPVRALLIGGFQALALVPGLSRSGMTIGAGLLLGLRRQDAAEFSFLLSIPAVLGASLHSVPGLFGAASMPMGAAVWVGALAAGVSGYVALRLLTRLLERGRFWGFGIYTAAVACAVWIFAVH